MATEKPFPFGAKSIEELEARDAAKAGTPPADTTPVNEPVVEEPVATGEAPQVKAKEVTPPEPSKSDWLKQVNEQFKTEFKSPDDFKAIFEKAKKADEYEPKVKGFDETEKQYKKQLDELQRSLNPLSYFSSQESYVAEQLRRQHPDKSPFVLQEIVTSDNTRMSDLDVLIKNQMLETPDLIGGENGAKEYILDKYGIDTSLPKEEWSTTLQNKIKIEANQKRKEWNELKSKVELPKVMTAEEREAETTRLQEEKRTKITPLKETFSKFDKFTEEIEEGKIFEFNVPDEYKEVLPAMFDTYFVEAGLDVNEDTLKSMEKLKRALLLEGNFKQIYKIIEGDVETRMKQKQDELLNNTTPPNTRTAAELGESDSQKFSKEHGLGKLFSKK